jgi:hypothetical protein
MSRIRVTIKAKRTTLSTGSIELDITDAALASLLKDDASADVWMRYTVAPMIRDWKSPPRLATAMGIDADITEAKWEIVD